MTLKYLASQKLTLPSALGTPSSSIGAMQLNTDMQHLFGVPETDSLALEIGIEVERVSEIHTERRIIETKGLQFISERQVGSCPKITGHGFRSRV